MDRSETTMAPSLFVAPTPCVAHRDNGLLTLRRIRTPFVAPYRVRAVRRTRQVPCDVLTSNPISTSTKRARPIRVLVLGTVAIGVATLRALPLLAAVVTGSPPTLADAPGGFASGVTTSLALVLASEIGDKTFFISALLSMRYGKLLVLLGTMLALGSMTVISVGIGQLFHAVPVTLRLGIPLDDYAAVVLLLYFGVQNIRESIRMRADEAEEWEGAKQAVAKDDGAKSPIRVVTETSSLVFFAEWGDKSMLATVALAAAKSPLGVIVGGVTGHFIASIIAVISGSFLGRYISEKNVRLIGGVLFIVFAILTLKGVY